MNNLFTLVFPECIMAGVQASEDIGNQGNVPLTGTSAVTLPVPTSMKSGPDPTTITGEIGKQCRHEECP